jgi:genetic interactor of prohibitins 3, mitochondrial
MRVSPQEVCNFIQRAQLSLLRPNIQPAKTLLRRVAHRQSIRATSHQAVSFRGSSANDVAVFEPFSDGVASHKSPGEHAAPISVEAENAGPLPPTRQKDGLRSLPISCPGCGALIQEAHKGEAGFYTRSRKAVKVFLRQGKSETAEDAQESGKSHEIAAKHADDLNAREGDQGFAPTVVANTVGPDQNVRLETNTSPIPVCDRCHDLIYNSRGVSIAHPSIDSLADSIAESPFRQNHVYHVLDAADFPLSLVPSIYSRLSLAKPRTQNRRSKHKFSQRPTISFIITRSDLLGPTKEMVDSLMPYFTSVLRTALGRSAEDIRLGNVHLVSSKRGWWTRDIKESIWKRGGGSWMVGKVNVGKSNLFEVLFPKGFADRALSYAELEQEAQSKTSLFGSGDAHANSSDNPELLSETSLLPPPQPETHYPVLPLISSLPGTTASPIRLPFGNNKGELIDLPGLARGNLDAYVSPEHKLDLVMTHRPTVTQHNIKPGQSLLLGGGLVRITPTFDEAERDTVVLAYPFVPIAAHVTATEKAIGTQMQQRESGIRTILSDGAGESMTSAGTFRLATDVTRGRAGPLLRAGVKVEKLPFRVFATDILIEGVGWVELVCQVRKRRQRTRESAVLHQQEGGDALSHLDEPPAAPERREPKSPDNSPDEDFPRPIVEVFAPEGKHVGQRRCMGAWLLWNEGRNTRQKRKAVNAARPRKSMRGVKKREKVLKRRMGADAQAVQAE